MTTEFLWTIPTRVAPRLGFSDRVTDDRRGRFTAFDEYVQVARAAELAGFDGVVVPYDPAGEESWVLATALARETPRLGIVPEFPPDLGTAVYAAKLALSFQRFFADRLSWQVVLGGAADASLGDHVTGDDRHRRAEEFLTVTRGLFSEAPYTFAGDFFEVEGGGFFDETGAMPGLQGLARPVSPHPRVVLSGERDEELDLSARFADVHLFDEARPYLLADAVDALAERARSAGRTVRSGLRVGVVARDFDAEARRDSARATGAVQDGVIWSGFEATKSRGRHALVGSFDAVAEQLRAYIELGVTTFVLDGLHPVADAYSTGEYLLPLVHDALASA
jgi:alkanesulfonate monooxygenase